MHSPPLLRLCFLLLLTACRDELAGPSRSRDAAALGPSSSETAPATLDFRSGGRWGRGGPTYLGAQISDPSAKPGEAVTVRHFFRAGAPLAGDWSYFVHAVDPETGEMLANLDHPFQEGRAAPSTWPEGRVLEDRHRFVLPSSPSGQVELRLGFWKGRARLPISTPDLADGAQRMKGPSFGEGSGRVEPPTYPVRYAKTPPLIDGTPDEAVWEEAEAVTLRNSRDGGPVRRRTVARLLWDPTHLYVAFEVEDPDVWGTHRDRDAKLYEEEVVEIFIDADGDGRDYNELQVSPHNVLFDAAFTRPRADMDLGWDSGTRSAVRVDGTLDDPANRDRGWSVELAIPLGRLSDLPRMPPQAGDRWRFNLYRLEHLERGRRVEGQSFAPLYAGDFHRLSRFGWLSFEGGPAVDAPPAESESLAPSAAPSP